jgi:hypothetical protein
MVLFTQALGGGIGSTTGSDFGSSFASADFSLRTRGLSGKRSAAIVSRSNLMTAARSSGGGGVFFCRGGADQPTLKADFICG